MTSPSHCLTDQTTSVNDPKTKVIRTWNERSGVKPTVTTAGAGYFAEYQEQPILVKPGGKFATVNVVFTKQPTEKTAYEAVMAEATQAVQRTHGQISVTVSVYLPAGCTSYRYDFWFKKQRYLGSTEQTTKKAARNSSGCCASG
jgi:hypothetical protein